MTEEEAAQRDYEAGMAAWCECLPIIDKKLAADDEDATPFITGFLEAMFISLIAMDGRDFAMQTVVNAFNHANRQDIDIEEAKNFREH